MLFTFPSRYYFSIGHQGIFRLGRWSSRLPTGFHVSRGTLVPISLTRISLTGLLPSLAALSNAIQLYSSDRFYGSATPDVRRLPVWPLPISLAATLGAGPELAAGAEDEPEPPQPASRDIDVLNMTD